MDAKRDPESVSGNGVDRVSLTAGIATIAVGTVLLLDELDTFDISGTLLAALVAAAAGTILLISGLTDE